MGIETVLTSTVIAGIVAAIVSWWIAERSILVENITKERAKWRDRIREHSAEAQTAIITSNKMELSRLRSTFRLLLNPHHDEDKSIINSIQVDKDDPEKKAEEFTRRISLLLKHDWERSKREAKPIFLKGKKAQRTTYDNYIKDLNNR